MGKPATTFLLYSTVLALLISSAAGAITLAEMTHTLDHWFKTLNPERSTLAKFQLYIHANFAAENQTVFKVTDAEITPTSPSNFGLVLVIDNPLTTGLDPGSQSLGRYQGMNAFSDFRETAAAMNMNIIFSGGESDGSTISIMGRQPIQEEVRPMSVIGGTGVFRFAKGIVLASTYSIDPVTNIGTYVYDMYVVTPVATAGAVQTA